MNQRPQRKIRGDRLRRRAEKNLRGKAGPAMLSTPEANAARIMQELQIHQIELKLQNEELKQAKAEGDALLERYTDLYEFAPVGYFTLDRQGSILEVNLTGAAMLRTNRSRVTGRRFQLFVATASRHGVQAFLAKVFAGRQKQTCEAMLLDGRAATFWADLEAAPATGVGVRPEQCRLAVIDITARKQAEVAQRRIEVLAATNRKLEDEIVRRQASEAALAKSEDELRHISHQVIQVQETQRREISRRLHDEISQLLLGINVHLALFAKLAVQQPQGIPRTIAPLRHLVEESVRAVHRFALELRPAMLDDLGLIPALRAYINDFPRRHGQQIHFTAEASVEKLDNDKRTVLYRVAQEALTNVKKHARAHEVRVSIYPVREGVCLEVTDNGKAFDTSKMLSAAWGHHLGLISMRERVEMVGGKFALESIPGSGTTIRAQIPFAKSGWRRTRRNLAIGKTLR